MLLLGRPERDSRKEVLRTLSELRNCLGCDRLFVYVGSNLCPKCIAKEEDEFTLVRRWVRDHPGASIIETAEATGISQEKILRFLRDGRLISRGLKASSAFQCERCGILINEGRLCRECTFQLEGELRRTLGGKGSEGKTQSPSARIRDGDRIHILNSRETRREK